MKTIHTLICFKTILLMITGIQVSTASAATPNDLLFYPDGRITSFKLGGKEVLRTDKERNGFSLLVFDGNAINEIPLTHVEVKGDELHVGREQPFPRLVFKLTRDEKYLGLNLIRAEGIPTDKSTGIIFQADISATVEIVRLDYKVEDRSTRNRIRISWPYLWHSNPDDPLGGVAFFLNGNDDDNDESLARIWVNEHLPHPDLAEPWTVEQVFRWIEDYENTFAGMSETTLSASSSGELYYLTDLMHEAGIRRIYLHTDTWRGEYWPRRRSFVDVNPAVFPEGIDDLKRYADYLDERKMLLRLHNVSGGIGRMDPEFILTDKVERDLVTWVEGELVEPAGATNRTLRFRPEPGSFVPAVQLRPWWDFTYFRVGEEIVRSRNLRDVDKEVWTLLDVERGYDDSRAAAHAAGTSVAGLASAYGQNYAPDVDAPLFEEMASRYAGKINLLGLSHQHYDGYEIHNFPAWGSDKFSYLVAKQLKHPTTTSTSGGRGTPWQLERRFSAIKDLTEVHGYWPVTIPVLLDGHRRASSMLDAHYEITSGIIKGGRRVGLYKPEPMFGVSRELIDNHGLVPEFLDLAVQLDEVIPHIRKEHLDYLRQHMKPIQRTLRQRGNHHESRDVPVLEMREDGYYWVPTRVMVREGIDDYWIYGQEFGAIGPRQYLQPGEIIEVENPYDAQPPGVIVRVLSAYGSAARMKAMTGNQGVRRAEDSGVLDDYRLGADLAGRESEAVSTAPLSSSIWPDSAGALRQDGLSVVSLEGDTLVLKAGNQFNTAAWSEENHASWNCRVPVEGRRALSLDVEGDGSGAVLVVQFTVPGGIRDYAVKLDFKGRRNIVIPDGEVSWSQAYWGWRFATKHFHHERDITRVNLGIGYIPPATNVNVRVHDLRLLDSIEVPLESLEIRLPNGSLQVRGDLEQGEYFVYEKGDSGSVFDANWNFLREVPVTVDQWLAGKGKVEVEIQSANSGMAPWIELQLLTRGVPFKIVDVAELP